MEKVNIVFSNCIIKTSSPRTQKPSQPESAEPSKQGVQPKHGETVIVDDEIDFKNRIQNFEFVI